MMRSMVDDTEQPLDLVDADLAGRLRLRFAEVWLQQSGFLTAPLDDAARSLGLWVSGSGARGRGHMLRATSHYTGSSWWLEDWDGDEATAEAFVDRAAAAAAVEVKAENRRSGRPLEWDRGFQPPPPSGLDSG